MPRPAPATVADKVAVICNITDQEYLKSRDYGVFVIARKEEGEDYALTEVTERFSRTDLGEKNSRLERVGPYAIADDLVREVNTDAGEGSYLGVFVCDGDEPSARELEEAHAKLKVFYQAKLASADSDWERFKNPIFIDDVMRRAARYLGQTEKPWLFDTKPAVECPACAERIKPGVAVCKSCGAILDREKAEKFGLVQSAEPEEKQKKVRTI